MYHKPPQMRIGVRGCCGVGAARCPAPSFNAMKKKVKEDQKPAAGADFFNLAILQNQDQRHPWAPRRRAPGPPEAPRRRGPPPGGLPRPPPRGPTRPRGPPRPGPAGPPPRAGKKKKKKKKKTKINATTFAFPEAANTRTT